MANRSRLVATPRRCASALAAGNPSSTIQVRWASVMPVASVPRARLASLKFTRSAPKLAPKRTISTSSGAVLVSMT